MPKPASYGRGTLFRCIGLVLASLFLFMACAPEDDEPARREAFKSLLQRNILEQKGIRFPKLSEEQKSIIGQQYAEQYGLLNALSEDQDLLHSFSGLPELQQKLMRTGDLNEKQVLIDEAGDHMEVIREKLIAAYKKVRGVKDALRQPEDLQLVYDEAFLKVIQAPTDLLVELLELSLEAVDAAWDLNDFMLANPESARYEGNTVIIEKAEAEAEIQRLFEAYREKTEKALQTVQELNDLTW